MQKRNLIIALLKISAIVLCLEFFAEHYFFEIEPSALTPLFVVAFGALIALNWLTKSFKKKDYFKLAHIPVVVGTLFGAVHFRVGIYWALNTFPLRDANTVMLTLQEPFDDFAYSMVRLYLTTTIPQAFAITVILTVFVYTILNSTKKRMLAAGAYFTATIALLVSEIPFADYIHILNNEPEKNASYSKFFADNYIDPDSIKITPPEQKRNLILIYLESLETTFADKEHGGGQDTNLIPELTQLALQNLNFGKIENRIGGGVDAKGSNHTFGSFHTRSLGIPNIINYKKTPILHYYTSLYNILNEYGYNQIFFQGNSGLYNEFQNFVNDHRMDEVYGPDDLMQRLNLDTTSFHKSQWFKTVPDKDAFKFASQIVDTISEPFSLTFFTIDTHSPSGLYDPNCIKALDENNENERLKAAVRCASRELNAFIDSLRQKPFYEKTSIVIFGDHLFMGTRLVKDFPERKWIDIFINPPKIPLAGDNRYFSDIDMFPTILSSMNFEIEGCRLGFGTDLFSNKKTLLESIGLDSLNKGIDLMSSHLIYESFLLRKKSPIK